MIIKRTITMWLLYLCLLLTARNGLAYDKDLAMSRGKRVNTVLHHALMSLVSQPSNSTQLRKEAIPAQPTEKEKGKVKAEPKPPAAGAPDSLPTPTNPESRFVLLPFTPFIAGIEAGYADSRHLKTQSQRTDESMPVVILRHHEIEKAQSASSEADRLKTCPGVKCPGKQECVIYDQQPVCTCNIYCNFILLKVGPVCGNDGRTYGTLCGLRRASCRAGTARDIYFQSPGRCPGPEPPTAESREENLPSPADYPQQNKSYRVADPGDKKDRLQQWTHKVSDYSSSQNQSLSTTKCPNEQCPTVSLLGEVAPAAVPARHPTPPQPPKPPAMCGAGGGRWRCRCKLPCGPILSRIGPVCGTNGLTYRSLCLLRRANCRAGKKYNISFKNPGPCKEESGLRRPGPETATKELPAHNRYRLRSKNTQSGSRADLISKMFRRKVKQFVKNRGLPL